MITKEQYLENLTAELNIIRHLGTKIKPEMLEYRPHEKQRSMLELMNYLGHAFDTGVTISILGDSSKFMEHAVKAPKVTLENFDSVIADETAMIRTKIEALTDADFSKECQIFNRNATLAMHLFGVLKWVVAYKMQLFLYIKACGNHDISTSNLWGGVDMPPKQ